MVILELGMATLSSPNSTGGLAFLAIVVALETWTVVRGLSKPGILRPNIVPILATVNILAAVMVWNIARLGGQPVFGWSVIVACIAIVVVKYLVALRLSRVSFKESDALKSGDLARVAGVAAVGNLMLALGIASVILARTPAPSREVKIARQQVKDYRWVLGRFVSDHGRLPRDYSELAGSDEFLREFLEHPQDPWRVPLHIPLGKEEGIDVVSAGPDRKFGTADDIRSDAVEAPR